jgi:hypothetical protein
MARPPKYASDDDKPVSVTLRIPRDLYDQAQHHAKRRQTTLTELVREGLQLRLETPTDPRDILASQDITVMHELRQMIATEVQAALTAQGLQAPAPAPTRKAEGKSKTQHYSNATPEQVYDPEPGHSLVTESTPQHTESSPTRAYGEVPAAVLAALAHQQSATAAEIAQALGDSTKQGIKTVWQALQRLCKSGRVLKQAKRYQLVSR